MLKREVHGHPFCYLDSAATAQKPQSVIDAIQKFYAENYGTVHRAIYCTAQEASMSFAGVRRKLQKFFNASFEEEIIFTRGTTDAINLVAATFGKAFLAPGDEILISEMEHHSNIVPWQMIADARGAHLKVIPFFDTGELDLVAFKELLTDRTKIVAITHVSNVLGTINPIKEIVREAHAVGAKVLVDGAQSAPHLPVDVQELDCDFFVFSGHKMMGPTGIGCLYGKRTLLEQMPPYQGGGDMVDTVTFEKTTYNVLPFKFEAGTPSIAEVIGLGAAIDFLAEIGMERIQKWEEELLSELLDVMSDIPKVRLIGQAKQRGAIVTFTVEGVHPLDLATMLDLEGIAIRSGHLCAQPLLRHYNLSSAARVSLACYNTKEELHLFAHTLRKLLQKFEGECSLSDEEVLRIADEAKHESRKKKKST